MHSNVPRPGPRRLFLPVAKYTIIVSFKCFFGGAAALFPRGRGSLRSKKNIISRPPSLAHFLLVFEPYTEALSKLYVKKIGWKIIQISRTMYIVWLDFFVHLILFQFKTCILNVCKCYKFCFQSDLMFWKEKPKHCFV